MAKRKKRKRQTPKVEIEVHHFDEPWDDFLRRVSGPPGGPRPQPSPDDVRRAIYFWRLYPTWFRKCRAYEHPDDERDELLRLWAKCSVAQEIITAEAERHGLDSSWVAESGDLCERFCDAFPDVLEDGDIKVWPPDGMLKNPTLEEEKKRVIHEAERVLHRLDAQIAAAGGTVEADAAAGGPYRTLKQLNEMTSVKGDRRDRFRKAAQRGEIRRIRKAGGDKGSWLYSEPDVQSKWPELFS